MQKYDAKVFVINLTSISRHHDRPCAWNTKDKSLEKWNKKFVRKSLRPYHFFPRDIQNTYSHSRQFSLHKTFFFHPIPKSQKKKYSSSVYSQPNLHFLHTSICPIRSHQCTSLLVKEFPENKNVFVMQISQEKFRSIYIENFIFHPSLETTTETFFPFFSNHKKSVKFLLSVFHEVNDKWTSNSHSKKF